MKKRLEADLISIAHRILQIKDKSDINQLYLDTQKLYEKLSVLKFIEENYGKAQPTIGSYSEIEKEIEQIYDKATLSADTEIEIAESVPEQPIVAEKEINEIAEVPQQPVVTETIEASIEEVKEETNIPETPIAYSESTEIPVAETSFENEVPEKENPIEEQIVTENKPEENFKAAFELTPESDIEEDHKKPEAAVQISFEDFLGVDYSEPQFVKVEDAAPTTTNSIPEPDKKTEVPKQTPVNGIKTNTEKAAPKSISLNDKLSKGIDIDLNDRLAFVKHLFGNSNEDYTRVMNQLITYDNFYETKSFIDEMVKPDYNDWKGKEEYEDRFMEIIEKKFL